MAERIKKYIYLRKNRWLSLLNIPYQFRQSIAYPYWWKNYKWWGLNNPNKNPIYRIYWKLKK